MTGISLNVLNGNLRQTCVSWNGHQAATPQLAQCAGSSGLRWILMESILAEGRSTDGIVDVHLWELPAPDGLTDLLYARVVGLWVNAKHVTVQLQLSAVKITMNRRSIGVGARFLPGSLGCEIVGGLGTNSGNSNLMFCFLKQYQRFYFENAVGVFCCRQTVLVIDFLFSLTPLSQHFGSRLDRSVFFPLQHLKKPNICRCRALICPSHLFIWTLTHQMSLPNLHKHTDCPYAVWLKTPDNDSAQTLNSLRELMKNIWLFIDFPLPLV